MPFLQASVQLLLLQLPLYMRPEWGFGARILLPGRPLISRALASLPLHQPGLEAMIFGKSFCILLAQGLRVEGLVSNLMALGKKKYFELQLFF